MPTYADSQCSGFDLYAIEDAWVEKGKVSPIGTGIAIEMPPGYEVQVRARSGLASNGIIVLNGPGTIDESYRGEIKVLLTKVTGEETDDYYHIKAGDRIAQGVLSPVTKAHFVVVDELSPTDRGVGGFGSTGR